MGEPERPRSAKRRADTPIDRVELARSLEEHARILARLERMTARPRKLPALRRELLRSAAAVQAALGREVSGRRRRGQLDPMALGRDVLAAVDRYRTAIAGLRLALEAAP